MEGANTLDSHSGHLAKAQCFWIEVTKVELVQLLSPRGMAVTPDGLTVNSCTSRTLRLVGSAESWEER